MLNGKIDVARGFQTSVNIAFDLYNNEKIRSFIPTISSLDIIEDVMLSTATASAQRARILIGAYGRGKSHIILVLMSLLFKKDRTLFETILNKMRDQNPDLYEFVNEYIDSDHKLLPIVVSGSSTSLTQSFLSALQQSLSAAGLDGLMPETHFRASVSAIENWRENYPYTYRRFVDVLNEPVDAFLIKLNEYDVSAFERFVVLYPSLTSGSTFNPFFGFDVVELYEKVTDKLCENGYDGVFIIYDEFSKYLESSIGNATINDIELLQNFAEKCDRSGKKQMHLMLICHKDIANYIDSSLPKEKVDGWRGVSGRFKHINLHNNFSQMYEIISAVIKKEPTFWDQFCLNNSDKFDDLCERFTSNRLLNVNNGDAVETAIMGCYPLHPISTFILPRLSEKIAQNERTLFTFLSADDKFTLSAFLHSAGGDFPMLTPDMLYDYFEPLLRKEPYTSETHKMYKLTSNVLEKVDPDSLGSKIIKTISLIYIIEQFEKLPPIYDIIVDAFRDTVSDTNLISEALSDLIDKECIIYLKRSNNYLKLKESSGADIPGEIEKVVERMQASLSVAEILNYSAYDSYMYPTKYNDEHEITRYFDFIFVCSDEFFEWTDWENKLSKSDADGIVYAIIPTCQEEIAAIRDIIIDRTQNIRRILFVIPQKYQDIEKIAYEYKAVIQLKALATNDELLIDEYDIYIEDLEEVIGSFIYSYARPENGGAEYYYGGERQSLYRKAQMSALLSRICEETFPYTPIINNESINKNHLTTVAINSRTKILAGLLANQLNPNLGMTGTGQEVSIMRSTLIQTGILTNIETEPAIEIHPDYDHMDYVLGVIDRFFVGANEGNGQNFSALYDELTAPQHGIGLKLGVIPIYIAVILHLCKQNLVIKSGDSETRITPDLLNSINENPSNYIVIMEDWNEEKALYMAGLEELFSDYAVEKEKAYNAFSYIVTAMNRWYMALPKYAKEMSEEYWGGDKNKFSPLPLSHKKFINSLKQINGNPREYLFEKLISIFGHKDFTIDVLNEITTVKCKFEKALPVLLSRLANDVKIMFAGASKKKTTLTSAIRDWYERLKPDTIQYLFPQNENKILELMKSITNDEMTFMQRLCKAVTFLRVDDWTSTTISTFLSDLAAFKETVEDFDKHCGDTIGETADSYRIAFTDANGNEVVKSFVKTEYGRKAKLLMNEITTALDEMGKAITEQEKRQVLVEILEKLC